MLVVEAIGQRAELGLEERERCRVLQRLGPGPVIERGPPEQHLDAVDGGLVAARARQDGDDVAGVALLLVAAPAQVAGSAIGIPVARELPAPEVVGPGRDEERVVGIGDQLGDPPVGEAPVCEREGELLAADDDAVGVLRVGRVDRGERGLERAAQVTTPRTPTRRSRR